MAASSTATKELEEKLIPEDESSEAQGTTEETSDEEDDDDEIDEELLDLAATFGVNPDDFEDASELEKEIHRVAGQRRPAASEAGDGKAAPAEPEELALEAYSLKLSGENIDEGLITELQNFSKAQTAQFTKALNDLRAEHRKEVRALTNQVQRLTGVTDTQVRQNDFRLVDKWVRKNEKAQVFYGEGDYDDLDQDSRHARRRRSLVSKAYRIRSTYQGKRPPSSSKLLDMAFAATPQKGKGKDKPPKSKTITQTARATGSGAASATGSRERKPKLTEEQQLEEQGEKVEEWQRQHGISS
jgi:hypothetical protein